MIVVELYIEGKVTEAKFPDTRQGSNASIKFVQIIAEQRKRHPFFYKQKLIEALKGKIGDYPAYSRSEVKERLQQELQSAINDRKELLEMCDCLDTPPPVH
jgi:hypothetical protein